MRFAWKSTAVPASLVVFFLLAAPLLARDFSAHLDSASGKSASPRRPRKPYPANDPAFHYLGRFQLTRPAGAAAVTETHSFDVMWPGMDNVLIDKEYRQADDQFAQAWYISHSRGVASSATVADIPAGFLMKSEGKNFSSSDPKHIREPGNDVDALQITLHCEPRANDSCSVQVRVWVKMKPEYD